MQIALVYLARWVYFALFVGSMSLLIALLHSLVRVSFFYNVRLWEIFPPISPTCLISLAESVFGCHIAV